MEKRITINIALLIGIAALSGLIFLPSPETEQPSLRLSELDAASINRITVERENQPQLIFAKQEGAWYMQAPSAYRANQARINAMLRMLDTESHATLDPAALDLERFDLATPAITLNLNEWTFQFGGTDAIDQRRYVLFRDQLHLINDFLYYQLVGSAAFFADLKLLPEAAKIEMIRLPHYQIERIDQQWRTVPDSAYKPDRLSRLIFNWEQAHAISVADYQPSEGEDLITLSMGDGELIEFVIVSMEPHLILGRTALGIQYHMGSEEVHNLLLSPSGAEDTAKPGRE